MPDQKPMWTRWLGGFSVMWVTKLLISLVKKRIFCPKTTKFCQKIAFLVNLARPCRLIQCPVGESVRGCGARAVSRKTPIYFIWQIFYCSSPSWRVSWKPQLNMVQKVFWIQPGSTLGLAKGLLAPSCQVSKRYHWLQQPQRAFSRAFVFNTSIFQHGSILWLG